MSEKAEVVEDTKDVDSVVLETARVGYEVAVNLWTYQGSLIWNRFNIMLTANSVLVSVIGVLLSSDADLTVFAVLLPIVGLVLCVVWILLAARGFVYHKYWASRACELEEAYLRKVVRTVSEAKSSRNDSQVKFSGLSKWGGQKEITYLVISIYAAVFVVALVYTILALV
jgi:amino acid permease